MGSHMKRELAGIALLLFAVFLAGALLFQRVPAGGSCMDARGVFGPAGTLVRCAVAGAVGLPAAALVVLLPLVHALRLFGRLAARADRSWLVFVGGLVVLLPIALGLLIPFDEAVTHPMLGLWGQAVAFYLPRAFGTAGAWLLLALGLSALTALTLSWNPLRLLVGRGDHAPLPSGAVLVSGPVTDAAQAAPAKRGRKRAGDAAVLLEPAPEEMPAMDPTLLLRDPTPVGTPAVVA